MVSEVSVTLNGRVYTYKHNGKFYTWLDYKNLPVPLMLHTKLREKAISEGKDESIFLSKPKTPRLEHKSEVESSEAEDLTVETKKSQKKKSTGLINPFAK